MKGSFRIQGQFALSAAAGAEGAPGGAAGTGSPERRFDLVAYNGGALELGWGAPVVVDLSGLDLGNGVVPVLLDHVPHADNVFGQTDRVALDDAGRIVGSCRFLGVSAHAKNVFALAERGYQWQMSIGCDVKDAALVRRGEAKVNGRAFKAPCWHVKAAVLREISICPLGADKDTEARMVARRKLKGSIMSFNEYVLEKTGKPVTECTDEELAKLREEFDALGEGAGAGAANGGEGGDPEDDETEKNKAAAAKNKPGLKAGKPPAAAAVADPIRQVRAEMARIERVRSLCAKHQVPELLQAALDEGWSSADLSERILAAQEARARNQSGISNPGAHPSGLPAVPADRASADNAAATKLYAAGLCRTYGKMPEELAENFGKDVVAKADARWGATGGLTLGRLVLAAAQEAGLRVDRIDELNVREVAARAFAPRLAASPSTIHLPRIMETALERFMLPIFNAGEKAWTRIAAVQPVNDFREYEGLQLKEWESLAPLGADGEIEHLTLSERSYRGKVERLAKMASVTEMQLINDREFGIFGKFSGIFGNMATRTLNKVIWGVFNANGEVFAAKYGNLKTGRPLDFDNLEKGIGEFGQRRQDKSGDPLEIAPKYLVVPAGLSMTARAILKTTERQRSDGKGGFTKDQPDFSDLELVSTAYLEGTTWYLLADPHVAPVLETPFLRGKREPRIETIQSTDAKTYEAFSVRANLDFGATLVSHEGGMKFTA